MQPDSLLLLIQISSILAFIVFALIAPLWSLRTCVTAHDRENTHKLVWVLFMIFFWPLGQIVFAFRRKHKGLITTFVLSGIIWLSTMTYLVYSYKDPILEFLAKF